MNNSKASVDVPILEIFQTKFPKDHHQWNQYWSIATWSQTVQIWDNTLMKVMKFDKHFNKC